MYFAIAVVLALATGTQAFSVRGLGRGRSIRFTPKHGSGNSGAGGRGRNNNGPFGLGASGDDTPSEPELVAAASDNGKKGIAGIWDAYCGALESHPITTKSFTSFFGFTIGDLLAQTGFEKGEDYDVKRTLRLVAFGFFIHGPTSHYWYGALDNVIKGVSTGAVISKVIIDQLIWNPIECVGFFTFIGMLEGEGIEGCKLKLQNDLKTAVTGSWKVWPLAHAVNFRFIPTSQRVLYMNCIQVFYNVFLSKIANHKVENHRVATPMNDNS